MKTTILIILSLITLITTSTIANISDEEFYLEEESYIDDIPFDTWNVAMNNDSYWTNPGFLLEEEEYVSDIPFSTYDIATDFIMNQAMAIEFNMEEEPFIDDISFDTKLITQNCENISVISDLTLPEDNSTQTNTDYSQVQSSSNVRTYIIGILLIIIVSAYSMTAFLL